LRPPSAGRPRRATTFISRTAPLRPAFLHQALLRVQDTHRRSTPQTAARHQHENPRTLAHQHPDQLLQDGGHPLKPLPPHNPRDHRRPHEKTGQPRGSCSATADLDARWQR
jgi:hypothetical protein